MPHAVILVGVPGSGKTTYRKAVYPDYDVCSLDDEVEAEAERRGSRYQTVFDSYAGVASRLAVDKLVGYASEGRNVVIDWTNLSRRKRDEWRSMLPGYRFTTVYFPVTRQLMIGRNRNRKGIPVGVLCDMYARLEPPQPGEEGEVLSITGGVAAQ